MHVHKIITLNNNYQEENIFIAQLQNRNKGQLYYYKMLLSAKFIQEVGWFVKFIDILKQ